MIALKFKETVFFNRVDPYQIPVPRRLGVLAEGYYLKNIRYNTYLTRLILFTIYLRLRQPCE